MVMLGTALGRLISDRLAELKMSQRGLSRRSGLSHTYISRVIRGEYGNLTMDSIKALARGLGLPVDSVLAACRGLQLEGELAADDLTPELQGVLRAFLELPPERQVLARQLLETLRQQPQL